MQRDSAEADLFTGCSGIEEREALFMLQLDTLETEGLYLLLKSNENELDSVLTGLLKKIETNLYEKLSIEEIENLSTLYLKKLMR